MLHRRKEASSRVSPELRDIGEIKVIQRILVVSVVPVEGVRREVVEQIGDLRWGLGNVGAARDVHLHEVREGGQLALILLPSRKTD